jgi:prophage DNA circulation protein
MAWRDELTQTSFFVNGQSVQLVGGSFRGVSFRTVNAELKVGRRNQVNEYPQRDIPYVDDLGRKARRIVVEAYVLGANYLQERDALIEAFETEGPGELLHPRYGALTVSLDGEVSIKETPEQGGMARISATFVEHGANTFPAARENTVAAVEVATNAVDEAAQTDFADNFSVDGASVLAAQALEGLNGLKNTVKNVLGFARQVTSVAGLATIVGLAGGLARDLAQLIRTPVVLVQSLRSIYAELVTSLGRPLAAFAELQTLFASNTRPVAVSTVVPGSTRARSLTNDVARSDLQRRLALSNQARVLAVALADTTVVATASQAKDLRNALVAQIDTELEVNDPPLEVATALTTLRAAVVRDVAARAEFLKQRSSYTPQTVLPAVVLAHRVYGDATRADELADRNAVPHPAFVPARALEVLV